MIVDTHLPVDSDRDGDTVEEDDNDASEDVDEAEVDDSDAPEDVDEEDDDASEEVEAYEGSGGEVRVYEGLVGRGLRSLWS